MSGGVHTTRQDDEYLLRMIGLRMKHQASTVAKMLDLKSERVRTMCNRVVDDDLRASCGLNGSETPKQVFAGYWRR
jgi:hypothetical protein